MASTNATASYTVVLRSRRWNAQAARRIAEWLGNVFLNMHGRFNLIHLEATGNTNTKDTFSIGPYWPPQDECDEEAGEPDPSPDEWWGSVLDKAQSRASDDE